MAAEAAPESHPVADPEGLSCGPPRARWPRLRLRRSLARHPRWVGPEWPSSMLRHPLARHPRRVRPPHPRRVGILRPCRRPLRLGAPPKHPLARTPPSGVATAPLTGGHLRPCRRPLRLGAPPKHPLARTPPSGVATAPLTGGHLRPCRRPLRLGAPLIHPLARRVHSPHPPGVGLPKPHRTLPPPRGRRGAPYPTWSPRCAAAPHRGPACCPRQP